ncbi:STAS domain-containing protein [Rhodoferax mekongensis]|uniref:STAS domain-containing protein n=1 Tax=Rhodoferax mekongensis TaxID=3068341 RepID=A0ABZ0B352_9BURK|nr:STAS domain-containing protein [Rhodoferax sp. TBRC 17307]WNO05883.1 STAS domain-containing protein [Rhodoferax sp. TBRC 17307]
MATKDERPGLLSKVAMFVRNPTKDWSELSRTETEPDSSYDKQALKAMIERKRQNDFVRKREFDQLRKLRNRDPSAAANLARPSFFQSSIPTDPDGRAVTLKKIDEIEAQMSKQWWKGKQEAAAMQGAGPTAPQSIPTSFPSDSSPGSHTSVDAPISIPSVFESTESTGLRVLNTVRDPAPSTEYAPTEMGSGMPPMSSHVPLVPVVKGPVTHITADPSELSFSTSKLFAMDVADMTTDPELEEAAIRFANGDDAGAEAGLIQALGRGHPDAEVAFNWAAALMDLYRATQNRDRFDWATVEYAHLWNGRVPGWEVLQLDANQGMDTTAAAPFVPEPVEGEFGPAAAMWDSPSVLTVDGMESLRMVLSSNPMPWTLTWGRLQRIESEAMPLLSGLFASLCDEPVSLRFGGAEKLLQALRNLTPSGDRAVDSAWWTVRLNALRAMQLLDEFELVALDYCVTYEVSPPACEPAKCNYAVWAAPSVARSTSDFIATVPMGLDSVTISSQELRGEVLGDAMTVLAGIDGARDASNSIAVSCRYLVRVDFSAAGSILNWVAMRQAEGCMVQFQDVHRLVAAFFNVIGISEHARVIPRSL